MNQDLTFMAQYLVVMIFYKIIKINYQKKLPYLQVARRIYKKKKKNSKIIINNNKK